MQNRYDNLLLSGNSFRFVGALYKVVGGFFVFLMPLVAAIAAMAEVDGHSWVTALDKSAPFWPIVVAVAGLMVGVPMYVRGVLQSAYGEAFVALADIAIATGASAPSGTMSMWDQKRGLVNLVGTAVSFAVGMLLVITLSLFASAKAGGTGEEKASLDGRVRADKPQARGDAAIDPMEAASVGLPSTDGSPIVRGSRVEFVVSSDGAEWGDDSQARVEFGTNAQRRRFSKGLRKTSDETPLEVAVVHGKYFSTKDFPDRYAPITAARIAEPRGEPSTTSLVGHWRAKAPKTSVRLDLNDDGTFAETATIDRTGSGELQGCHDSLDALGAWRAENGVLHLKPSGGTFMVSRDSCANFKKNQSPQAQPWGTPPNYNYVITSDGLTLTNAQKDDILAQTFTRDNDTAPLRHPDGGREPSGTDLDDHLKKIWEPQ